MSRLAIKICGLSTPETVGASVMAGATHLGFNLFPKSPRYVEPEQLRALAALVPSHVDRVAIVVDPDDTMLADYIVTNALTAIQLHGHETPARAAAIRHRFGLPVWKAISIKTGADIDSAKAFTDAVDFLLFDAKTPKGSALPGGMGVRFDWTLLRGVHPALPWGLSGGLGPDNVADALKVTGAPLVDVSSGVESAPGIKAVDKIIAFCKAAGAS